MIVYALWYDNGLEYDDHTSHLVGLFSTREKAENANCPAYDKDDLYVTEHEVDAISSIRSEPTDQTSSSRPWTDCNSD